MNVEVTKDGAYYPLELQQEMTARKMEALLREEQGSWRVWEINGDSHTIGRRKRWTQALADALDWMENTLKRRIEDDLCDPFAESARMRERRRS